MVLGEKKTKTKTKNEQKHIIILHGAGWECSLTRPVSQDLVAMVAVVLGRCTMHIVTQENNISVFDTFKFQKQLPHCKSPTGVLQQTSKASPWGLR